MIDTVAYLRKYHPPKPYPRVRDYTVRGTVGQLSVRFLGGRKLDDIRNDGSLSVGPQCASRGDNERREGYPPRSPALCCEEPKCAEKYERDSDEGARQVYVALSEWGLRDSDCRT